MNLFALRDICRSLDPDQAQESVHARDRRGRSQAGDEIGGAVQTTDRLKKSVAAATRWISRGRLRKLN